MTSNQALLFFCAIGASILTMGNTLQCYTCNTNFTSARSDDACTGQESVQKCNDPAVCLSAVLLYEDGPVKRYNAVKSCYLPQNGQECDLYLKNMQTMFPLSKISFYDKKCRSCDKDKCNNASGILVPTFLALIVSYIVCKLM